MTVEGSHIHEAYIVVTERSLVGFYLPVERTREKKMDPPQPGFYRGIDDEGRSASR